MGTANAELSKTVERWSQNTPFRQAPWTYDRGTRRRTAINPRFMAASNPQDHQSLVLGGTSKRQGYLAAR